MIAAEEHRTSPSAGGILSDSNDHAGFTFQISETPPPARTNSGTPLADLELEMGDFGEARPQSPLPPPEAPATGSAWLDEPVRLAPPMTSHAAPPMTSHPAPPATPDPAPPIRGTAHDLPKTSESVEGVQNTAPTATEKPTVPVAPRIKKISFPVSGTRKAPRRAAIDDGRGRSKTKFSKSIGAQKPRRSLDSESEVEADGKEMSAEMAPPEDLPSFDQPPLPPLADSDGWGTDTPSAREIWRKARSSWHAASRQAVALSGHGLRAGRALAESVNDKVKERLREAAEERAGRAEAAAESLEPTTQSPTNTQPTTAPSMAGKMILGLARSAGKRVAAPASALAAAALVYFAGSHLLGADGSVVLSKAVQGPEVPELGSLEVSGDGEKASGPTDSPRRQSGEKPPKTEKASASGPPPMQTEVTEMPQGMSWPGKGLIEVVTSRDELVYVDGVFTGRGPLRRIPVSPGEHEVSIRGDGKERKGSVEVQANKNTRAVFKGE